jgi:hypothetical protein|tara:strand:- start:783 stop:1574 length:792 start_codon:yes stop_codon:yes gene_type:complete
MAEQTELLDLASKFFNNIVKGFHNKVGDKDRGNKTISSSLVTEEVNKAKKRFKDKEDVVYTGPDFTTITKFTKKLLDAYNKSVLERTKRENVSSRKKNTAQTRKPNSPKIHTVSVKVNSNSNTRNKNIKVPEYKKPTITKLKNLPKVVNRELYVNPPKINVDTKKETKDKPVVKKDNATSLEVRNISKSKKNVDRSSGKGGRGKSTKDVPRTIAEAKLAGKTYFIDKNNNKKAAVTAEELKKSGLSLRDYLNKKRGLKRKTKK